MAGESGFGVTLSGASIGAIGNVVDINWPGMSATVIDVTDNDSTNGWREKIAGLKDAGEFTVTVNYTKAKTTTLVGGIAGSNEVFTITLPDGSTFACSGFISALSGPIPMDEAIQQELTITLSGEPTFTAAA